MKKIAVFYYGPGDIPEAKRLALAERAAGNVGLTRDAEAFNGELEECSEVAILPGVPKHVREMIRAAYNGTLTKLRGSSRWHGGEIQAPDGTDVILPETTIVATNAFKSHESVPEPVPLRAQHRGFGKFYVMRGDAILSGPHSKAEAQGLLK